MPSKFSTKRMNAFHIVFSNGFGISTIWGAMTYSSNRHAEFPTGGPEGPMEASTVEIMFIGRDLPEKLSKKVWKIIGEKSTDGIIGPYADVTVEEWMNVANLLNKYKGEA